MRSLDTRVNYVLAKIAQQAGRPDAAGKLEDAVEAAINDGYADYRNGLHTMPPMLSDVPMLNAAWDYGHQEARFFSGPDGFD
jgi:hypothetical protein